MIQPGIYRIKNARSNTYLDASVKSPGKVHCWSSRPGHENQQWDVQQVAPNVLTFQSVGRKTYLHASDFQNGSKVTASTTPCRWVLSQDGAAYYITAENTNFIVSLEFGSANDGAAVIVWDRTPGALEQKWVFERFGETSAPVPPQTQQPIVPPTPVPPKPTPAPPSKPDDTKPAVFTSDVLPPGTYLIRSAQTSAVVDLYGAGAQDNTPVFAFAAHSGPNQQWILEPGKKGYKLCSLATKTYLGFVETATPKADLRLTGNRNPVEWVPKKAGNGFQFHLASHPDFVLDLTKAAWKGGFEICLWPKHDGANQIWTAERVEPKFTSDVLSPGTYLIRSVHTGTVVDLYGGGVPDGTRVLAYKAHNGPNQLWAVESGKSGYIIRSVASKTCVGFGEKATPEQSTLLTGNKHPVEWIPKRADKGYHLCLAAKPDLVLDLAKGDPKEGAEICLWGKHDGNNQKWTFERIEPAPPAFTSDLIAPGTYLIRNVHTSTVVDLYGGGVPDSTRVLAYKAHNGPNQQWIVEPGKSGYILRSVASKTCVGFGEKVTPEQSTLLTGNKHPVEWVPKRADKGFYFHLASKQDLVLDLAKGEAKEGAEICLWAKHDGNNQKWTVEPVASIKPEPPKPAPAPPLPPPYTSKDLAPGAYFVRNFHTKTALDLAEGNPQDNTKVINFKFHGGANQQWIVESGKDGYILRNAAAKTCLSLSGAPGQGAQAIGRSTPLEWIPKKTDQGFELHVSTNQTLVLDLDNFDAKDYAKIHSWPENKGTNQKWIFEPIAVPLPVFISGDIAPGTYFIRNVQTKTALDLSDANAQDGTKVINFKVHGGPNQKWTLEPGKAGYRLRNVATGTYAGFAQGAAPKEDTQITGNRHPVEWVPKKADSGYQLHLHSDEKLVLDLYGGKPDDYNKIVLWTNNKGPNQKWEITPA